MHYITPGFARKAVNIENNEPVNIVTGAPDAITGRISQGSGPAAYMIFTTSDDGEHHGARLVCQILYLCYLLIV